MKICTAWSCPNCAAYKSRTSRIGFVKAKIFVGFAKTMIADFVTFKAQLKRFARFTAAQNIETSRARFQCNYWLKILQVCSKSTAAKGGPHGVPLLYRSG